MVMKIFKKDPASSELYNFEFIDALATGELILSVVGITVDPVGLTIGASVINGPYVQVLLSGGTADVIYTLTCLVTTSLNETLFCCGAISVTEC